MKPPWDPKMANAAAVADQCVKLGAVVLRPPKSTGFTPPSESKAPQR